MALPRLMLQGVSKTFVSREETLPVLKDISLHVNDGEFVSLLGPSGSGKSTLFRVAAGLLRPDSGRVIINGSEVNGKAIKIGYMPQKDLLLPWKSLVHNAALPLIAAGVKKAEAYARVKRLLPVFGLDGFENAYPKQLSGGMRQRAALLRTVLIDSQVMLLDEPFAALDALTREKLQEWLLGIWEQFKRSVLFITHSIDEAIYLSDRVYVISQRPGEIIMEQPIEIPRPRAREAVTSSLFTQYKQVLMQSLKEA
ncbi:MAG: ABC transporter ATP-binding protein [Bacillota bacterium]